MREQHLTVTEARRRLPSLLKLVASGQGPVFVGKRGRPEVVFVERDEYERLRTAAATHVAEPAGWSGLRLELQGTPSELDDEMAALRIERSQIRDVATSDDHAPVRPATSRSRSRDRRAATKAGAARTEADGPRRRA